MSRNAQGRGIGRGGVRNRLTLGALVAAALLAFGGDAAAQSYMVQCPTSTGTHPIAGDPSQASSFAEPAYTGPAPVVLVDANGAATTDTTKGHWVTNGAGNGSIKCQQVAGGDGYATMADGTQIYLFAFGPASGLADIASGLPGTQTPDIFNSYFGANAQFPFKAGQPVPVPGDPATTDLAGGAFAYNGAIGLAQSITTNLSIFDISEGQYPACLSMIDPTMVATLPVPPPAPIAVGPQVVTVVVNTPSPFKVGDIVQISGTGGINTYHPPSQGGYDGYWQVSAVNLYNWCYSASSTNPTQVQNGSSYAFTVSRWSSTASFTAPVAPPAGLAELSTPTDTNTMVVASLPGATNTGHIDPRQLMDVAVMNGNEPAPLVAIDEDDELFLTLSNVGMIQRPDLFEQHTIHFHGYPNAASFYDGVPDASVAIAIAASFSYYYLAPDAGTYFWHCHITPPEHLQMGMVGQLYVRPRQNRVPAGTDLYTSLGWQQKDQRTACSSAPATTGSTVGAPDFSCSNPLPAVNTGRIQATDKLGNAQRYAYNDGDGSTAYDVEYPIQMMSFDPNFHFVGMTFNGEGFKDMKDKYFLLNGRGYPDTVTPGPMATPSSDGVMHYSQPVPAIINIPSGGRALLRLSQLNVAEYQTLQSIGIPMTVIGWNAKLLRDQSGNNMAYVTNSITTAGGESADVILDATNVPAGTYYLYSRNLDQLANDAENFGGMMTEIHVCPGGVTGGPTFGNACL